MKDLSRLKNGYKRESCKETMLLGMQGLRVALAWVMGLCLMLVALPPVAHAYFFAPADGKMTSAFGWRTDPFTGKQRFHGGIDIAAASGSPVYATQAGLVVFSGAHGGYGNIVVLNHGNSLYTLYGHNARLLVQPGQPVYRGQIIALVGSTGRSTGPHLHFEVHYRQQYVNPLTYLSYIHQQGPVAASASPPVKKTTPPVPSVAQVKPSPKKPAAKKSARKTYNATVQLISGTQIKKVRF